MDKQVCVVKHSAGFNGRVHRLAAFNPQSTATRACPTQRTVLILPQKEQFLFPSFDTGRGVPHSGAT